MRESEGSKAAVNNRLERKGGKEKRIKYETGARKDRNGLTDGHTGKDEKG